jgi:enolase
MTMKINTVHAREILSTGAFPTIEAIVQLEDGTVGKASVPFGSSAGRHEAVTLADGDKARFDGKGMLAAVRNVNDVIGPEIKGLDCLDQRALDVKLTGLDPTPRREKLGGNAILSVSLAAARAASAAEGLPLYRYLLRTYRPTDKITSLPRPMVVVIEGGRHADESTDLQEYMVGILKDRGARENVRAAIEVYLALGKGLKKKGLNTNVGLEGAYAPAGIKSNEQPFADIQDAIKNAGYEPGGDIGIALDAAASELTDEKEGYILKREQRRMSANELIDYYESLTKKYRIFSIEDGLGEDDWDSWPILNQRLGRHVMIIGDDLTVTGVARLQKAIDTKAINCILIKPNQVGTLSETVAAMDLARKNGVKAVVSHRGGGETTDTFIIDLAVAMGAEYVKVGPSRGERVVKYNRLMEIGDELQL